MGALPTRQNPHHPKRGAAESFGSRVIRAGALYVRTIEAMSCARNGPGHLVQVRPCPRRHLEQDRHTVGNAETCPCSSGDRRKRTILRKCAHPYPRSASVPFETFNGTDAGEAQRSETVPPESSDLRHGSMEKSASSISPMLSDRAAPPPRKGRCQGVRPADMARVHECRWY